MRKLFPVLILIILTVFCTSANAEQAQEYDVVFQGINGSGVSGEGYLTFDGNKLNANIQASGLTAGQFHGMHIHGIQGQDLKCPSDTNKDGYMSDDEVHRDLGMHVLDLTPYPTADAGGNISFNQSYTEDLDKLEPLEGKVIVIHGTTVEGKYDADVAVGCGEIEPASFLSPSRVSVTLLLGTAIALIFLAAVVTLVFLVRRNKYLNRA